MKKSGIWTQAIEAAKRLWTGEVLIGPQDPVPPSSLALVTREYLRACSERGRGPHIEGKDLARAAAVYASPDRLVVEHTGMSPWPWPERCDEINQLTRVEQLTRAAVLCMREIDRLRDGGAVAQDHFAGGGKMVDNKEHIAAPCEREEPPVDNKDFRPGLPPLELIRLHSIWDAESVIDGERVQRRFHFIEQGGALLFKHWEEDADSLRPVTHQGRWNEVAFRPSGWTWEEAERKRVELESLAAAKVAADKQPEESRVRIYCWKVGTAFWRKPNGDCPECGKYGHNHRVLPANECGTFVDCQGKHGHPCVLPPDHEGPHAAPEALAECLHAAGNEMVKGGGG